MTDREFRRLSRGQLVDIIYELQKQLKDAQRRLAEAENQRPARETGFAEADTISEASAGLNEAFVRAQAAADQYVEDVNRLRSSIQEQADQILAQAQAQAESMLSKANARANVMLSKAKQASETMVAQARAERATILHSTEK